MQKVWPDTIVEESNITVGISRLRTLLEDDKHQPKYIVTLHRSGYRFIGKVRRVNESNEGSLAVLPYHIEMATTLGELAIAQASEDYFDEACEHYRQALVTSEAVGDHHRTAVLESNHGYLLLAFNNLHEAEFRLLRARKLFDHFSDRRPELDETLARLHLEMGRFELAEKVVIRSVNALESCGEEQELAESLRTYGRVLSRLRRYREARLVLDRAFQVAKGCGDTEGAGLALLIMIEEISDRLDDDERFELATMARSMLCHSQRISVLKRVQKSLERFASA